MNKFLEKNKIMIELIGLVVAIITFIVMTRGVWIAASQLESANYHARWNNYNLMNKRYTDLFSHMPSDIASQVEFKQLNEDSRLWFRQYLDLTSEEYLLYIEGLIPKEMWEQRIVNGIKVNLLEYPAIIEGFEYWMIKGGGMHPEGFVELIDRFSSKVGVAPVDASQH